MDFCSALSQFWKFRSQKFPVFGNPGVSNSSVTKATVLCWFQAAPKQDDPRSRSSRSERRGPPRARECSLNHRIRILPNTQPQTPAPRSLPAGVGVEPLALPQTRLRTLPALAQARVRVEGLAAGALGGAHAAAQLVVPPLPGGAQLALALALALALTFGGRRRRNLYGPWSAAVYSLKPPRPPPRPLLLQVSWSSFQPGPQLSLVRPFRQTHSHVASSMTLLGPQRARRPESRASGSHMEKKL